MSDLISRQETLDALHSLAHRFEDPEDWCILEGEAEFVVSKLPSAQLDKEYAKAVRNWLVNYQVKCAELHGRYTPYEVLGWIVSDWRKENEIL